MLSMENGTQPTKNKHYVNGVYLNVVEAGPADGPLVILLHGLSSSMHPILRFGAI